MKVGRISYFGFRHFLFYTGLSLVVIGVLWYLTAENPGRAWIFIVTGAGCTIPLLLLYPEYLWSHHHNAGAVAFEHRKYEKAAQHYRQAAHYAERFGNLDNRIGEDLDYLATIYHIQKRDHDAEQLYLRALDVYAHAGGPGPNHSSAVQHDLDLLYADASRVPGT